MPMIRLLLLLLAIAAALVGAATIACGWFGGTEADVREVGWLGLSLAFGWASFLPIGGRVVSPPG